MSGPAAAAANLDWVGPMMKDKFLGANSVRMSTSLAVSTAAMVTAQVLAPGKEASKDILAAAKGTVTTTSTKSGATKRSQKVAVDRTFLRHFIKLLKIAMPEGLMGKQGGCVAALSVLLVVRTGLSLQISAITGRLARRMVEAEVKPFAMSILELALWSLPASLVNSGMKYLTSMLQISFRRNLTRYFHRRYLSQQNFFKCVGLGAVDSVEQRVTQDVQKFSDEAAEIYSTLFKPIIDIMLFAKKVSEYGGWKGPIMVTAYYGMITFLIRALAPNFGLLASVSAQKEGELRTGHTKLIEFAEEVTLSQGESSTLAVLNNLFRRAHVHYLYTALMKAQNNVLDGILVKYGSVMVGYAVCAFSVFSDEASKMNSSELTGLYMHTSQLLVNLARAIGQLIMTYKTVASLAGYTHRVYQLEDGLNQVERRSKEKAKSSEKQGEVVSGAQGIKFENVPIVSPDNTTLVKSLSFHVDPGMNLLIVGPNGCGKSSTFRLLGELWPIFGGKIEKPSFQHLYYVPQRPYMSSGTLRDQVIYPTDVKDLKVGESQLYECLERACLDTLLDQPNMSWGARLNWAGEALSQGQKQKLAMARLFFHRPRFAILDECTSAIDVDIEQQLYTQCKELGITLITIAHRRSLWKYHNWVLRFDGNGGYMFSALEFNDNDEMVLTKVLKSSDESKIGERITISLHQNSTPEPVDSKPAFVAPKQNGTKAAATTKSASPETRPQDFAQPEETAPSPLAKESTPVASPEASVPTASEEPSADAEEHEEQTMEDSQNAENSGNDGSHSARAQQRSDAPATPPRKGRRGKGKH